MAEGKEEAASYGQEGEDKVTESGQRVKRRCLHIGARVKSRRLDRGKGITGWLEKGRQVKRRFEKCGQSTIMNYDGFGSAILTQASRWSAEPQW